MQLLSGLYYTDAVFSFYTYLYCHLFCWRTQKKGCPGTDNLGTTSKEKGGREKPLFLMKNKW